MGEVREMVIGPERAELPAAMGPPSIVVGRVLAGCDLPDPPRPGHAPATPGGWRPKVLVRRDVVLCAFTLVPGGIWGAGRG